jgi:hypothetical protein
VARKPHGKPALGRDAFDKNAFDKNASGREAFGRKESKCVIPAEAGMQTSLHL